MHLADTADVVLGDVPAPGRDGVPLVDRDLHRGRGEASPTTTVVGVWGWKKAADKTRGTPGIATSIAVAIQAL